MEGCNTLSLLDDGSLCYRFESFTEGLEGEDVVIYVKEGAAGKASAAAEAAEPATLFSGRRLGMTRDEIVALEKRDPDQTASTSETVLELD